MAQAQAQAAERPVERVAEIGPRRTFQWHNIFVYTLLLIFTLTSLGPFIFSFFSSFKTFQHVLDFPPTLLPQPWTWSNYATVLANSTFPKWLLNSFIYAAGAMALNVLFSAMAGYALSRMQFRGREIIFLATLGVTMIPAPITIISKFLIVNDLHMTDTFFALILPAMAQPFSVFLMMQFFKSLQRSLEESAMLDGASRLRTFFQIILPLVKPALTAVAILSFQGAWNDFLWSLLVLSSPGNYTLPIGLNFFKNAHFTEYNLLLAGSM